MGIRKISEGDASIWFTPVATNVDFSDMSVTLLD